MSHDFHFIQSSFSLLKATAQQIEKFYDLGYYIGVLVESEQIRDEMDRFLWTYKQISFIPHATDADSEVKLQPVYISTLCYFPNTPQILICVDCIPPEANQIKKILIFNQMSKNISKIRSYYKSVQDSGMQVLFTKFEG